MKQNKDTIAAAKRENKELINSASSSGGDKGERRGDRSRQAQGYRSRPGEQRQLYRLQELAKDLSQAVRRLQEEAP